MVIKVELIINTVCYCGNFHLVFLHIMRNLNFNILVDCDNGLMAGVQVEDDDFAFKDKMFHYVEFSV